VSRIWQQWGCSGIFCGKSLFPACAAQGGGRGAGSGGVKLSLGKGRENMV